MGGHEPNLCGSGWRQEAGSCSYVNEISGSNKFGRNQQLPKKDCVAWSYLRCRCVYTFSSSQYCRDMNKTYVHFTVASLQLRLEVKLTWQPG